eukprot:TRINITY_DN24737_c0_g1_i2.p1 TRINITY_DN24737_c0_g1~~TRINITY_DN24737_c0_g1_i2.p1  ORF type:complete len:195 (-),score=57.76 TRINITY_DN24737_c0_g1_i2:681-1265(-)
MRSLDLAALGGKGTAGCGDGDAASSSSGVLAAIGRIKETIEARKAGSESATAAPSASEGSTPQLREKGRYAGEVHTASPLEVAAHDVLSAEIDRVNSHGKRDIDIWRQGGGSGGQLEAPPQVSKAWDDRRRISSFTWESSDPTSEQQSIKGVFAAAVASLQESGFAVDRAISRLKEMQTVAYQENHKRKHLSKP